MGLLALTGSFAVMKSWASSSTSVPARNVQVVGGVKAPIHLFKAYLGSGVNNASCLQPSFDLESVSEYSGVGGRVARLLKSSKHPSLSTLPKGAASPDCGLSLDEFLFRHEYLCTPHLSRRDLYARVLYDSELLLAWTNGKSTRYLSRDRDLPSLKTVTFFHYALNLVQWFVVLFIFDDNGLFVVFPCFRHFSGRD